MATVGMSVDPIGTLFVGLVGEDYLLFIDKDGTISIGRDVAGEWRDGELWLTSPHTSDAGIGFNAQSTVGHPNHEPVLALPIIERLLADPTLRLPVYD